MNLLQGDCLELMVGVPDGSVDLVLADPPYGTTACRWDSVIPLDQMWAHLKRIIKPNGAIVIMASQPFTSALIMSNPKWFKYSWVWEKPVATGFLNAKKQPLRAHEDVVVFYRKQPTFNPEMTEGHKRKTSTRVGLKTDCYGRADKKVSYDSTSRYPRSVQKFSARKDGKHHATSKPVDLMEYLIRTYSHAGETVLDFAMGSGTTGVACVNTGRQFIGIELDDVFFEISRQRIDRQLKGEATA